ncbi:MAG: ATP-binding protein [Gammaproteobacteria bacterium]|nr:ATP-binding protein [Gammaproteobacteria bacterium]
MSTGVRSGYPEVARQLRTLLDVAAVSVWIVDRTHRILVKEAMDVVPELEPGWAELEADEKLARWQLEHGRPLVCPAREQTPCAVSLPENFDLSFVSLPVEHKGERRGALNLYSRDGSEWFFQRRDQARNMQFLRSLAGQMAIFAENRSLEGISTFYKEIHHRVKNNLQTVAGLLRMQIRRLDRLSAEQALEDSINRILSIALVHDTLAQGEIGMVDFGQLVSRIVSLQTAEMPSPPQVTVEIVGPTVMLTSREATSLALVVNELVQNAIQHSRSGSEGGRVHVGVQQADERIEVAVIDDGAGLPDGFDIGRDANLGLTIVATLVEDELKGEFVLSGSHGTVARVVFPALQDGEDGGYELPDTDCRR